LFLDRIRASLTAEYLEISETPEISTSVKAEANTATKQKPMQKPKMDSFKIEEAKSKQFGTSTSLGDVKLRPSTSFDEKQKLMSHRLTSPALKTTSPAVQTTIPALRTTSSMVQTDFPMEIETQTEVTSTQEETSQIKTENPPKQDFYKESSRETSKVRFHSDSKKSLTESEELLNFNVDSKLMWDPLDDSTLEDSEKLQSLSQIHKNTIKAKSGSYSAEATSKPKHGKIPDSLDKKESTKEKTDSTDATEKLGETDTPSPRAKDDNEVNNDGESIESYTSDSIGGSQSQLSINRSSFNRILEFSVPSITVEDFGQTSTKSFESTENANGIPTIRKKTKVKSKKQSLSKPNKATKIESKKPKVSENKNAKSSLQFALKLSPSFGERQAKVEEKVEEEPVAVPISESGWTGNTGKLSDD